MHRMLDLTKDTHFAPDENPTSGWTDGSSTDTIRVTTNEPDNQRS